MTGRPCVWAEAVVERAVRRGDREERTWHWDRVSETVVGETFDIGWNGATATVNSGGATVHHAAWSEWYGPAARPDERDPPLRPGTEPIGVGRVEQMGDPAARYRYRERHVMAGQPVFVLGEVTRGPGPGRWVIGAAAGRPFLISTRSPDAIGTESRLAAKAGLWMAAVFAALALGVLWLRFG
ncbi:MAG: E3 ubiquitin ligase family protein [Rhodobacteraceae bacterium]|nr:E3 ubiquitin ligase family protein [Paracoccaceae bacterium]